jgi:lipopolysaccharide export system permease protein
VAPFAERQAARVQAGAGGIRFGRSGAWLKDHADTPAGERSYSVSVGSAEGGSRLRDVRIFEFDADGRLLTRTVAARARVDDNSTWLLEDVSVTHWLNNASDASDANAARAATGAAPRAPQEHLEQLAWPSGLSAGVVGAAVLPVSTMSTLDLFRYIVHLADNEQAAQGHEIQFWKRALYPFACLVMIGLALPFAYLHARGGGVSLKVFGGIMLGISFVLINNVAGHLGLLRNWTPWVVAATPSALYLLLSLAAFSWLVRYR